MRRRAHRRAASRLASTCADRPTTRSTTARLRGRRTGRRPREAPGARRRPDRPVRAAAPRSPAQFQFQRLDGQRTVAVSRGCQLRHRSGEPLIAEGRAHEAPSLLRASADLVVERAPGMLPGRCRRWPGLRRRHEPRGCSPTPRAARRGRAPARVPWLRSRARRSGRGGGRGRSAARSERPAMVPSRRRPRAWMARVAVCSSVTASRWSAAASQPGKPTCAATAAPMADRLPARRAASVINAAT